MTKKKREKQQSYNNRKFEECIGYKRKTWNYMKELMFDGPVRSSVIDVLSTTSNYTEKQSKIDEFNKYYATIGDTFNSTNSSNIMIPKKILDEITFKFEYLTLNDTRNLIMKLKNKNSSGPDGISPILMKLICDEIAPSVMLLINESIRSGKVPNDSKIARVIGIYKGGDANQVSNFRPISVTSILLKLIEMAVNSQLSTYIEENNILSPEQYGFRLNSNTTSACFDLVNNVCKERDDGNVTCLTFIDT